MNEFLNLGIFFVTVFRNVIQSLSDITVSMNINLTLMFAL